MSSSLGRRHPNTVSLVAGGQDVAFTSPSELVSASERVPPRAYQSSDRGPARVYRRIGASDRRSVIVMARKLGRPDLPVQRHGSHPAAIGLPGELDRSCRGDTFRADARAAGIHLPPVPGAGVCEDQGEQLHVCERVVISPCAGVFEPTISAVAAGTRIEIGTIVGRVSRRDVHSLFAGRLMAMLALPGERMRAGQPVAWLRTD